MTDATMTRAKCANTGSTLDAAKVRPGCYEWSCGQCGDSGVVKGMSAKAEDQLADHWIIVHGEDPDFVWEETGLMAKPGEGFGAQRARRDAGLPGSPLAWAELLIAHDVTMVTALTEGRRVARELGCPGPTVLRDLAEAPEGLQRAVFEFVTGTR